MTTYNKPLPVPQPESDAYWQAARESRLLVQRCTSCEEAQFFPRNFCTACGARTLDWFEASGRGTLYAFSIIHRAPHPGFSAHTPYIAAIVELEEGPRMPTNIVGVEPDPKSLRIGMPLTVVFEKATEEITLPKFRPA